MEKAKVDSAVELRRIPHGGMFRLEVDGPTYIRGSYDRCRREFFVLLIEQHSHRRMKGDTIVYPRAAEAAAQEGSAKERGSDEATEINKTCRCNWRGKVFRLWKSERNQFDGKLRPTRGFHALDPNGLFCRRSCGFRYSVRAIQGKKTFPPSPTSPTNRAD